MDKDRKVNRVLTIYSKLMQGDVVNKKEVALSFNVNEKTIQRDLEDIRNYLYENRELIGAKEIIYRRDKQGYRIENIGDIFTKEDVLAVMKVLLESRAFCKDELMHLTSSMLKQLDIQQRRYVKEMIGNELFNYVPLKHNKLLLSTIWNLSELIRNKEVTEIKYLKVDGAEVKRVIKPVAIIFSEYYFYLIAYFNDFELPTIFRVDRIQGYKGIGKKFYISGSERFEDGEFRKRVQFMYSGKLEKIRFEFSGTSIEAVLDRIPTAKIIDTYYGKYLIEAEVYGRGIIMWLLSQGDKVRVISPEDIRNEVLYKVKSICDIYENIIEKDVEEV